MTSSCRSRSLASVDSNEVSGNTCETCGGFDGCKKVTCTKKIRFFVALILFFGTIIGVLAILAAIGLRKPIDDKKSNETNRLNCSEPKNVNEVRGFPALKSLGAKFECPDKEWMKPSETVPTSVDRVRPADIKVIGALGDSYTVGKDSRNYDTDNMGIYPGNSYVMGGDESMETHSTFANILRHLNPHLIGFSTGVGSEGLAFNRAVAGVTCYDLPRQAEELVKLIQENKEVSLKNDWKFVNIFIGTNDINHKRNRLISTEEYKKYLEDTIGILKNGLPRTIVNIISMFQPHLSVFARPIIQEKSTKVPEIEDYIKRYDEYRNAAYEIQNELKFIGADFTVVVQGFMDEYKDAFRNSSGDYDRSFYAFDFFHLSKYGNDVIGKWLWNGLLEPVGKKNKKADLGNDHAPLVCPTQERQYVATVGNSL